MSPTCNQRTTTDTARDLPLDHQATENARFTVKQPEPQEKKERFTADKPTDGKRERFTVGPPDHEKRERFAVGPPDKRSNAENALKQQLFLIPLSVSSVVGLGPVWGLRVGRLHGGTLGKCVIYMGEADLAPYFGPSWELFLFHLKKAEHT